VVELTVRKVSYLISVF